jgi:hypothetical protein
LGIEVGKIGVGVDRTQLVAEPQIAVAFGKGGASGTSGGFGNGWELRARKRHGD